VECPQELPVQDDEVVEISKTIKTLILEIIDSNGSTHIREIHLQSQGLDLRCRRYRKARLSEMSRTENLEERLKAFGNGFYGPYQENKELCSVVSYPDRGPWEMLLTGETAQGIWSRTLS